MAEVAGFVLAGIPILIWALDQYAEPFEMYTKYHVAISTLKTNLQLQQWQLEATLASVGLHQPSPQELKACFEKKFADRSHEYLFIIQRMDHVTAELMESLAVDVSGKPRWTNEPPERAKWEWRRVKRSFGSKKRQRLLQDLRTWNEDLRICLEKSEVPARDDNRHVQKVMLRYNQNDCDKLRQSLRSLHRALESAVDCEAFPCHAATLDVDWVGCQATAERRFRLALLHGTDLHQSSDKNNWTRFYASHGQVKGRASSDAGSTISSSMLLPRTPSPRSSVRFDLSKISGSLRKSEPTALTTEIYEQPRKPSHPTINNLCAEFKKPFLKGETFGLLEDPASESETLFHLSHVTHECPDIVRTMPLKALMSTSDETKTFQDAITPMSAKQRYGMAASIVWAIFYLGGGPWLSEQWNDDQVKVTIERSRSGQQVVSKQPCIMHPFQDTFPDQKVPESALRRSLPNKTLFALGITLIELATNETLYVAKEDLESLLSADLSALRSKLDKVYREAGDSYGYAAQRCIKCDFQGQTSQINLDYPGFRQQFYDTVVAPVQATYEVFQTI